METASLIDLGLDQYPELEKLEGGKEYELQIVSAQVKVSKEKGNRYLQLILQHVGDETSEDIREIFMFPDKDSFEAKQNSRFASNMREMLEAFGLDPAQPFEPSDLVGNVAWAVVGERDDPQYGKQNYIRAWSSSNRS